MDKDLSFTATLQFNGSPINVFGSMTTGSVILSSPGESPGHGIDGASALGALNGNENDWAHGQELGLVTFGKAATPEPLLLYFRHAQGTYRIYVRGGPHQGKGLFVSGDGLVEVQPIANTDPTHWRLLDTTTGAAFDLASLADEHCTVTLTNTEGHPVESHGLYPVGMFLACYPNAKAGALTLDIAQRGVDWLNT